MDRRTLLKMTAGAGSLAATGGLATPVMAQGNRPLFRIVGGMMEASNDRSSANYLLISQWGVQTPLRRILGGTRCWTQQYGGQSYSRLSLYLAEADQYDMVVGGTVLANNNDSNNQWVQQSSWGNTGAGTTKIEAAFSGYGWSPAYQQGYIRSDLYMAKNPSGPYPMGGRYISNNTGSTDKPVTETFWGFSDGTENVLFGGYNWSTTYNEGYGQLTVFTKG